MSFTQKLNELLTHSSLRKSYKKDVKKLSKSHNKEVRRFAKEYLKQR